MNMDWGDTYEGEEWDSSGDIIEMDEELKNAVIEHVQCKIEIEYNGKAIAWNDWADLDNITPAQAARLVNFINPITWPDEKYNEGDIPKSLMEKIVFREQWLESRAQLWTLADLVTALGDDLAPFGMVQAAKPKPNAVTWSGDIQALEPLTVEQRQAYNKLAAWTWVDAIYILQDFKPCPQISTEQVRSHFPGEVNFFTQSIQLGNIGKEITQAGERTFIDSPVNWGTFWQDKLKAEQQAVGVGNAGTCSDTTRPASAKNIKSNNNEFAFSGLLHIPSGVDDWFEVIDVMTKAFYENNNAIPTKAKAWAELCTNTPIGYGIESNNNQSLKMPGVAKELNKRSFDRRWVKYTAKSNPFKPN